MNSTGTQSTAVFIHLGGSTVADSNTICPTSAAVLKNGNICHFSEEPANMLDFQLGELW